MENELVVQVSMKQEMELAMKLLEKDIHEKQVSNQTLLHLLLTTVKSDIVHDEGITFLMYLHTNI